MLVKVVKHYYIDDTTFYGDCMYADIVFDGKVVDSVKDPGNSFLSYLSGIRVALKALGISDIHYVIEKVADQ